MRAVFPGRSPRVNTRRCSSDCWRDHDARNPFAIAGQTRHPKQANQGRERADEVRTILKAVSDTGGISPADRRMAFGAIAGGVVNILKAVLQLLLLPVMARLLGPNEFGLYALALPTISLVTLLADGGLGATLAREQESSSLIWSSAFWALLVMGTTLAIGSTLFGSLLGYLAQQPRLPAMIALLSLSLVFLTLSVVPGARLTRRKNLALGAGADLASTVI